MREARGREIWRRMKKGSEMNRRKKTNKENPEEKRLKEA